MYNTFSHIATFKLFWTCFFFISGYISTAQNTAYIVKQLTKKDGLTSDVAYYLHQDKTGLIWISTEKGLNRYDGHRIKVFQCEAQLSNGLRSNRIFQVTEGRDGILWIATGNEILHLFDPIEENFHAYELESGKYPGNSRLIAGIEDTINQKVWLICRNLVACLDRKSEKIQYLFPSIELGITDKRIDEINNFHFDSEERKISVATNFGVFVIDFHTDRLQLLPDRIHRAVASRVIYACHREKNFMWFTLAQHKVVRVNRSTEENQIVRLNIQENGYIRCITELDEKTLIMGSLVDGVWLYNKETGNSHPLHVLLSNEVSGYSTDTWSILTDSEDRIWVATADGLYIFQKPAIPIQHFQVDKWSQKDAISAQMYIEGLTYYSGDDLYLVGARNGRLKLLSRTGTHIWETDIGAAINDLLFWRGYHWLATDRGLNVLRDGERQVFDFHPEDLGLSQIIDLERGNDGHLYGLGANDFSIFKIDSSSLQLKKYPFSFSGSPIIRGYNSKIRVTTNGIIWVNALKQIVEYNPYEDKYRYFDRYTSPIHRIASSRIRSMGIDRKDQLWIGHNSAGLELLQEQSDGSFKSQIFTETEGMLSNQVLEIESDLNDNLWITNSTGLSFYQREESKFSTYTDRDGLIRENMDKFIMHSLGVLPDNRVFLGEFNSFSIIDRNREVESRSPNQAVFTGVSVFEDTRFPAAVLQDNNPISLSHDENFFTIYFTAPNLIGGQNQYYRYRLDKYDRNWRFCQNGEAPYTNVPPGKYRFEVFAGDRNGIWEENFSALDIRIIPAFYQTHVFKLLLGLIVIGIAFILYRLHIRNIKEKQQLQSEFDKRLMEAENSALRAQINPHFIFNALNSIKGYIAKNDPKEANRHLNNFSKLMRLVLRNSRQTTISLEKELEALDVYIQLELLRFQEGFKYEIVLNNGIDPKRIFIPPMIIQPFVENAIWHGLLQKKDKGRLSISINWEENTLKIRIKDNGIGRKMAQQIMSKTGTDKKSYGIEITKQRIENFNEDANGSLPTFIIRDLQDSPGQSSGTEVILCFPKQKVYDYGKKTESSNY